MESQFRSIIIMILYKLIFKYILISNKKRWWLLTTCGTTAANAKEPTKMRYFMESVASRQLKSTTMRRIKYSIGRRKKEGSRPTSFKTRRRDFMWKIMGSLVNISMIHMKVGTFEHITMVSSTTMDARHRPNISNAIGDYNQTRIILYLPSSLQIDSFDFYSIIIVYPSKMKQTVILNLFLIFILCQLAFSQAVEVDSKRGNATKGKSQDSNKNPIPPSIRKCQNVHCEAGFFCLHGRCKKVDYGCTNLKCEKGFRCNKGQCVKQVHEPKQQVCKPLGYSRERLQCGPEQQNRCLNNSGITGVCGFIGNGKFQDF